MSGSATFTTVMSSSSMKIATQTMIRARHFLSMPGNLPGPGATASHPADSYVDYRGTGGMRGLEKDSNVSIRMVSDDGAHAATPAPEHAGQDG